MNRETMTNKSGKIVIISSPSGGGKTSICRKLLSTSRRKQGWNFSISYTTRKKRPGERNGREYYFVNENKFKEMVNRNLFAEHFKVHLYRYGTPRKPVDDVVKKGGVTVMRARALRKEGFDGEIRLAMEPGPSPASSSRSRYCSDPL